MILQFFKKNPLFCFIFLSLSIHSYVFAQSGLEQEERRFFENVRFGGSLGVSFSEDAFSAFLAPKAVYDFNQMTSAGLGLAGSYTNADNYTAHSVTGSIIGLFRPIVNIQLSSEFEENYVSRAWELEGANKKDSYWYPALFLGAGYISGPVTVGIRYDILYDNKKSIYGSALMPFISVYF